jgi:competence protein ComEA
VNSALPHEIAAIPGIGPATARAIVRDRREHGPFRSMEDLDRVPGVGPKTASLLAIYVSFE